MYGVGKSKSPSSLKLWRGKEIRLKLIKLKTLISFARWVVLFLAVIVAHKTKNPWIGLTIFSMLMWVLCVVEKQIAIRTAKNLKEEARNRQWAIDRSMQ